MAGTGKSTICRTVAQSFAIQGRLGGSFFFKRGEAERGHATRFFATLAAQLATKFPAIGRFISQVVGTEPSICTKALTEQFRKLIFQPLSKAPSDFPQAPIILVIDALDECEEEDDIETILHILAQFHDVASVNLRVFVTSRPELPIRLGFKNMSGCAYKNLILHEVPRITIQHDISEFLDYELTRLRLKRSLNIDWPSQENIQALVEMAVPLFIFAATLCRFVGEKGCNAQTQLTTILNYQLVNRNKMPKLDRIYVPILNQLFGGRNDENGPDQERLSGEFRNVVGTIVVLANPLSINSLARLLNIKTDDVTCKLDLLHSVLNIPPSKDRPVRLLHSSFREFLLDPMKQRKSWFNVDKEKTHERIASQCLRLMSNSDCLKKDICKIRRPGTLRSKIDAQLIEKILPAEVKYACRFWVYHLEQSKLRVEDNGQVHLFLQEHLLHWLEAMSLLESTSESIEMITTLLNILEVNLNSIPTLVNGLMYT